MNNFRILSFRHNFGFTTIRPDGSYWAASHPNDHSPVPDAGATLNYMLNHWKEKEGEWIEIYSIQDLNTGIVYTIDDRIKAFDKITYINAFDITNEIAPWAGGFGIKHDDGKETTGVEHVIKYPIEFPNV